MQGEKVEYHKTGKFSQLVLDHIADSPTIEAFRAGPQSLKACLDQAKARIFPASVRQDLVRVLRDQYSAIPVSEALSKNLDLLAQENTFTVTAGHQCVLLTGPLFFPFKVLNVIRMATQLKAADAERNYVPVLWLATEDHDREEINHVFFEGKKIEWRGAMNGAVGRGDLNEIADFLEEYGKVLGASTHAKQLLELVESCYKPTHTLAQATQLFCNALFGGLGLVVLDADDHRLKKHFIPVVEKELSEQFSFKAVSKQSEVLKKKYFVQVNPREINLFYLGKNTRERIEEEGEGFKAGEKTWSKQEILAELQENPSAFSPNVLLRPVYQELVLPNIAYVGGGGELAYWMQLKELFQVLAVPMPLVFLRSSALFLSAKAQKRMGQLELDIPDLFQQPNTLRTNLAKQRSSIDLDISAQRQALKQVFDSIANRINEEGYQRSVKSAETAGGKLINRLEKKLIREAKRAEQDTLRQLDELLDLVFPGGGLQERKENFSFLYLEYGPSWSSKLIEVLDVFDKQFTVIR